MTPIENSIEEWADKSGEEIAQHMLALADLLYSDRIYNSFDDELIKITVAQAATLLRVAAPAMVANQCRMELPYARLYQFRDVDGNLRWTCDHNPAHIT